MVVYERLQELSQYVNVSVHSCLPSPYSCRFSRSGTVDAHHRCRQPGGQGCSTTSGRHLLELALRERLRAEAALEEARILLAADGAGET